MSIKYLCPTLPAGSCDWQGDSSTITDHFESNHTSLLLTQNNFALDITTPAERNVLMSHRREIYLLQITTTPTRIEIKLRLLGSYLTAAKMRYYLEIIAGEVSFFSNECSQEFIPVKHSESGIEIDTAVLRMTTRTIREIICCVHFESSISQLVRSKQVSRGSSFTLKQICPRDSYFEESKTVTMEERCTNCNQLVISPIYTCLNDHSICIDCIEGVCSSCNSHVSNVRNYQLEAITKKINYSCCFAVQGCKQIVAGHSLDEHETRCTFCVYNCPQCSWVGRYTEVIKHFRIVHPSVRILSAMTNPFVQNCRLLVANNFGVFFCSAATTSEVVEWNVTVCGVTRRKFVCEVTVRSKKNWERVFRLMRDGENRYEGCMGLGAFKAAKIKFVELAIKAFI